MARSKSSAEFLEAVLHDAQLHRIWIGESTAELIVSPLRKTKAGKDHRVFVTLSEIGAVCVCHEPNDLAIRPSAFLVPKHLTLENVSSTPEMYRHAYFYVANRNDTLNHLDAERVDWLIGQRAPRGLPLAIHCSYQSGVDTTILIWYRKLECCELTPLSTATWLGQYEAWWREWEGLLTSRGTSSKVFSTVIPAGENDGDTKYWMPAPDAPISTISSSAAARKLLPLVNVWAKEQHKLDRRTLGIDGSMPYLRELVECWQEGNRAFVSVRGVQYDRDLGPDSPVQTLDMIFRFRLLRRNGRWAITRSSRQRTRAANSKLARKRPLWIKAWRFGKVE